MNSGVKKKVKFKHGIFQRLFWVISVLCLLILLGIFIFKFIVNSKIYGNDDVKAYEYVIKNIDESDGLYRENDRYVFKGKVENNYLQYGNLLFRIIKVYKDGSMEVIMNEGINSLYFNNEYSSYLESDIHEYLNDYFLELFDKNDLNKSVICRDIVDNVEKITCNDVKYSSYVKLLMLGDYVNSIMDGETYLNNADGYYWLGSVSSNKVWIIDGNKISLSDVKKGHQIKPVVTLNGNVKYLGGNGSKEDPIVVKEREVGVNSYVKIENDLYLIIDKEKSYLKLMLIEDSPLVRDVYNDTLLENLNSKYYDSLKYKDILVKYTIDIGDYRYGYCDIKGEKKSVYVGIPTINDFKFKDDELDYLLINKFDEENIFYYNNELYLNDCSLARKIRPVIMIEEQVITGGNGLAMDPYIVEVQ